MTCYNCQQIGHVSKYCRNRKAQRPEFKQPTESVQPTNNISRNSAQNTRNESTNERQTKFKDEVEVREYTEEVLSEEEILKEKEYVTNVCMVYEKTKIEKIIRFEDLKLPKSKKKGRDRSAIETLLKLEAKHQCDKPKLKFF